MKLTNEEKDIIKIMIFNELEFYDRKEDFNELDEEYVKSLNEILNKLNK